ncbi:MAG: hypothetical protein IJY26_01695 [Clostridia bacterium]|nr:hypothetical protein [Clostridia bacterium]
MQVKSKKKGSARKKTFIPDMRSEMDAEGMYTGIPGSKCFGKIPVQDADDL